MGWTSVGIWTGALGFIIYMAPIRPAPDVGAGRVYGWANHGTYVYLSSCEDVMVKVAMVAAGVLFVLAAWIESKTDPWQRRVR